MVTDSAYQIDMKGGFKISDLIFSFYNSLTLIFSELDGRYYGGGVLELTPKEFKGLPIPFVKIADHDFDSFKDRFSAKKDIDEILMENDRLILGDVFGIDAYTLKRLQLIKKKLTNKRLRIQAPSHS